MTLSITATERLRQENCPFYKRGFSVSVCNALHGADINTIEELKRYSYFDLLLIPGIGKKSIGQFTECFSLSWENANPVRRRKNKFRAFLEKRGIKGTIPNAILKTDIDSIDKLNQLSLPELVALPGIGIQSAAKLYELRY